jgi:cytochrome c oxidase cbb3-type subunit III
MSPRRPLRSRAPSAFVAAVVAALLAGLAVAGCWREQRELRTPPAASNREVPARLSALQPGQPQPTPQPSGAYQDNAFGISEGQRLFSWYNCTGCHANGGGGSGPALMDRTWIYGSEPQNIYATIAEGRPNGMPSFGGHIPSDEIWKLVAYVRSLAGLQRPDTVAPRSDRMAKKQTEQPK